MHNSKYHNLTTNLPINTDTDGCDLLDWASSHQNFGFAYHPDGFKIFLLPDKLKSNDEYIHDDPYSVEKNIEKQFHQRRIENTLSMLSTAVPQIHGTPKILDLGCGQGHITHAIQQVYAMSELSGIDYSTSAIAYAHNHYPNIDFSVADVYEAPYTSDYFDIIVSNNLWEHVPDPLRLLDRIKTILKTNGFLIISTPSRYRVQNLARVLLGKPVKLMSKHHVTEYTVGQVVEQLTFGGFAIEKIGSKAITPGNIKEIIAKRIFSTWIKVFSSHHHLESTIFYLAKKI